MKRTAIVTGGSRGIGFATALRLGREGCNIAILDINRADDYRENLGRLAAENIDFLYMQGSIAVNADRREFLRRVLEKYGEVDILVNNAGVGPKERLDILETTEESFDHVIGTNLRGTLFMTQLVVNQMRTQPIKGKKRGTVVTVSSCSTTVSSPNRVEYCISKAGLSNMTLVLADRLAAEKIFVYEVRPGVIDTDMTKTVHGKYDKLIADGVFPVARWGMPEDVAEAIGAFCGDAFNYSTGNYMDVDGGFHIQRL